MNLRLKRTPGIYLVGFMGSGKSTVGRMLAEALGWNFADLDEDIERAEECTIAELFVTRGEEAFREIEHQALLRRVRGIQSGQPTVLALGGGVFTRPENVALIRDNGVSIWLDVAFPILRRRVSVANHRPLARDPNRFEELFQARRACYRQADCRIELEQDDSSLALQRILDLRLLD